ncbi:MAG: UDP-N-acetylmuramyl-tripeptide synthetase, partial [Trueperaceae bacterium]
GCFVVGGAGHQAALAATVHGDPSHRTRVLGVTGTDGKTTTAVLLWWLLQELAPTGLASTALMRLGETALPGAGGFTTPEATEVQTFLARAVEAGATRVVLESSSHGLALGRLDHVRYAAAVWTNLTPEHLDFHGDLAGYLEAKQSLIRRAPVAVLNRDDAHYDAFASASPEPVPYGAHVDAAWRLLEVRPSPGRLAFRFVPPDGRAREAVVPMVGAFNAHNALAALAAASLEGLDLDRAVRRLATFPGVPGRMQVVQATPFAVVCDFAHTAPALETALRALTPTGRTIVVIGAAGERDPAKRGPLGAAAASGAGLAILTEEDHRGEDLDAILDAMAAGAREAGGTIGRDVLRIPDRSEAIRTAIAEARPGDVVLLAGKGHETTLQRGDRTVPWNEIGEARAALAGRSG